MARIEYFRFGKIRIRFGQMKLAGRRPFRDYGILVLKEIWGLLCYLYSPSCREGVFSETQRHRGHKKRAGSL